MDCTPVTTASSRLILLFFLSFLGACSTTQVQESWRLPGYQAPAQQKVLVVAMAATESIRKVVETEFSQALEQKGITAIPSYQWIPDGTRLNREAVEPIVRQNGVSTVLVTSIRDIQKTRAYQPEPATGADDGLFRSMDTFYTYSSSGQHEAGSYATLTDYLIETNLFDSRTNKLSWSVITRTTETGSVKKAVGEVVKTVMKRAEKEKAL